MTVEGSIDGNSTGNRAAISADGISVTATDSSRITATAGSAAVAAAVSGTGSGGAISIAVALAENVIDNDVTAKIDNADSVTSTGPITIAARTLGQTLPTPDFTSASGSQTLAVGQTVKLADDYENGGEGGRTYAYRGFVADYDFDAVDHTSIQTSAVVFEGDTVKVDTAVYRYVGDDKDGDGKTLNLTNQVYANTKLWEPAELSLHTGNTVKKGSDVYRYLGEDDDVDLNKTDYTNVSLWKKFDGNMRDLGISDYSDTKLWELADGSITARSIAASLAAGVGASKGGLAVSGAGALSRNVILSRTNAFVDNSTIATADSVSITADNAALINATVIAAALAVGVGGKAGVGASIGVSIAENMIGWDLDGNRSPAEVQVFARNSSIVTGGGLDIAASRDRRDGAGGVSRYRRRWQGRRGSERRRGVGDQQDRHQHQGLHRRRRQQCCRAPGPCRHHGGNRQHQSP
jgi:hypothetical protein